MAQQHMVQGGVSSNKSGDQSQALPVGEFKLDDLKRKNIHNEIV